jgi:hypothetical protein
MTVGEKLTMKKTKMLRVSALLLVMILTVSCGISALAAATLYPIEVQELADGSGRRIVRVYEPAPGESPDAIPTAGFERSGYRFELTEIIRQETEFADSSEHTETVTLSSATRELEDVLPLLAPTMEYVSEDGYSGTLMLDINTIAIEESGTAKKAYTMNTTREYPHLSSNDSSLIPKTVTERGLTYTLAGIDWQAQNLETVDSTAMPDGYKAVATYSVSGSKTVVIGYTITAEYRGGIVRTLPGKTRYTAYFAGEPLTTPQPEPVAAPATTPFNPISLICIAGGALLIGGGGLFAYKKLKGKIRKF